MTNAILRGKPDAGNPHVRFDEGEVASAKPRRGSLLYKTLKLLCTAIAIAGFATVAWGGYVSGVRVNGVDVGQTSSGDGWKFDDSHRINLKGTGKTYVISGADTGERDIRVKIETDCTVVISNLTLAVKENCCNALWLDANNKSLAATVRFCGKNSLSSGNYAAGIGVVKGQKLVLAGMAGTDELNVQAGWHGAGIGGADSGEELDCCGTVYILGGRVFAQGGSNSAGIGGGGGRGEYASGDHGRGSGGVIYISDTLCACEVEAIGGYGSERGGAGIGGGAVWIAKNDGTDCGGGTLYVDGGKVVARGGKNAPGIGGAMGCNYGGSMAKVVVSGGTVEAIGNGNAPGIGGAANSTRNAGFSYVQSGGRVKAVGGGAGAFPAVGGQDATGCGTMLVSGGTFEAKSVGDAGPNHAFTVDIRGGSVVLEEPNRFGATYVGGEKSVYPVRRTGYTSGAAVSINDFKGGTYGVNDIFAVGTSGEVCLWLPRGDYSFAINGLYYMPSVDAQGGVTWRTPAKTAKAVVRDGGKTLKFVYDAAYYGTKDTEWFSVAEAEAKSPSYGPPWFKIGAGVTKVNFLQSFRGYKPKHCGSWFSGFECLTTVVGLENLDTSAANSMIRMFYGCDALKSLDLLGLDTSKVTSMESMFDGCSSLTTLDVSGFNTSKVTDMGDMFCGCSRLTSLDLSGFDTANVTDMGCMFEYCSLLTTLDVSGFDTAKVTDMHFMFAGSKNLKTISVSDRFVTTKVTDSSNMFWGCTVLVGGRGTKFSSDKIDMAYARIDGKDGLPGYFTPTAKAVVADGGKTLRFVYDGKDYGTNWFSVAEAEAIDPIRDDVPWHGKWSTVTKVVFDPSFAAYRPKQCGRWFCDFSSLATIEGINNLDTSVATNMTHMFDFCGALKSLDVTHFHTANVTDMRSMFFGCSSLTTLDVSGFNTANVLNMGYMFGGCSSLTTLDVSGFNTSNVTDMYGMFLGCSSLVAICASDRFVTGQVSDSSSMFKNCSKLKGGAGTVYDPAVTDRTYARIDKPGRPGYFTTNAYIVRYHKYDGSGTTRSETYTVGVSKRLLYMDSQLGWSRSGYEFVGWAPDPNSRLCKYLNGEKVKDLAAAGATVDLYATWLSPSSYRVCFHRNFDASDATKLNQIVLRNTETVLAGMNSLIGWTRTGYTFMGWAETAGGTVKYANCAKVLNLSSIAGGTKHLYAVWKSDGKVKYTVCFHKYDGSGTTRSETYTVGVSKRLLYMDSQLKWSRSGYEFVGWAPDENSRLCKYQNGDVVLDLATENGATVHLYATWLSPSSYRVCFHRNFDSKDETKLNQIVLRNTETVLAGMNNLIKWTRTGYAFMGWAETAGGAVKYANCAKVLNLSSIAGGTKHLYAVWKASQTVVPPVKPQTLIVKPQTSSVKPQTSNFISGVFADGSGWFDLIVEEDWTAFFRAETEDGVREAECEADEVDDALVLTFADAAPLVIRLESGAWVAE